ncbi:MAG: RNA polymerase sigma factor [Streptosporangiaceae bacterium]
MSADKDGYQQRERRFRQLYEEHYRSIQAYAIRRVHTLDDVADVVAEVFTTAWRRLDDIPPPPADRVWLYGTARRTLADHYRGARRRTRLISRVQNGYAGSPQTAEFTPGFADDRLIRAMGRLPEGERETLMLVYWEQLSHAEAAQVLGCSPNAVAIRTHRAKERLRDALASAAPGSRGATAGAFVSFKTHGS